MSSELTFYHDSRYGLIPPEGATNAFAEFIASPTVYLSLYDWAMQQSKEAGTAILRFLENPTEEDFEGLVKLLVEKSLIQPLKPDPLPKTRSIRTLILDCLSRGPRTLYDLYDLAQEGSINPKAAVRQAVRVLSRKGKVIVTGITVRLNDGHKEETNHNHP